MRAVLATVVFLLAMPSGAWAQAQPKRSRAPFSALEVERSLVLPKGWFEIALVHLSGRGEMDTADGLSGSWAVHGQELSARVGLARRLELFAALPVHEVPGEGVMGDASFGGRWELAGTDLPSTSLAVELGFGGASGRNPPVLGWVQDGEISLTFIGGHPSGWVSSAVRRQFGPLAVGVRGEGRVLMGKELDVVGWVGPSGWLSLEGLMLLQGGPFVFRVEPRVVARGRPSLERAPGWESTWVTESRARLGAEVHVSRGFELGFVADLVLGETSGPRFILPAFHRFGGTTRVRF